MFRKIGTTIAHQRQMQCMEVDGRAKEVEP